MTTFKNSTIGAMDLAAVAQHVAKAQATIAKAMDTYRRKSRKEHAVLMLEGRTFIKTMEQSLKLEDQAELLTQHQIRAATNGVSEYTPWIKLLFGKHNADGKQVKFGGGEYTKWEPDASYGRYMNLYEVIDREYTGPEDELLDWVLGKGGPSVIVEAELKRKREAAQPSAETITAQRDLYLEETQMPIIGLPEGAITSAEEFVSVILRKTDDGYQLVGVSKENAGSDFEALARKRFDALAKAKAGREEEAKSAKKLADAQERGARENREQTAAAMGMTVKQWEAKFEQMKADAVARSSTNQQNVG
jgi:hypothetical protein